MLNYNDVLVAQERHADMQREAAKENRSRDLMGSARISLMQRVTAMMAKMKQQAVRTEMKAKPLGGAAQSKAA
jgi:hypothetical protein